MLDKCVNRREFLKTAGFVTASAGFPMIFTNQVLAAENKEKLATDILYHEKYRPQFHFTPQKNWMNDPNGLVYYKGEYHLFFQHDPFNIKVKFANQTWGHAVSADLIHWKQLPNAIEPDDLGAIYSGSAVVDWNNTGGFKTGKEDVLVAFYTAAGEHAPVPKPYTQCIAYSNDRGKTWTKYKNNPVVPNIRGANRDPKVFWYEPGKKWIMVIYLEKGVFCLLSSKDFKQWTKLQEFMLPSNHECPDFFELPVDGNSNNKKWVFWGATCRYMLGSFDGNKFTPETESLVSCEKPYTFYAAQTWSDIPKSDGRRIQIAWLKGGKYPDMPFSQQMSIPCELTLRTTPEGVRLCRVPVREIKGLREKEQSWKDIFLKPGENILSDISGELFEIETEIEPADASEVGFTLRGTPLVYNAKDKTLSTADRKIDLPAINGKIKLHILIDRVSIEIFANDGWKSILMGFPIDADNKTLEIFTKNGQAKIQILNIWNLKSIWI